MKPKKKIIGFSFAFNGIREAIRSERNFRIHLIIALLVLFIGVYIRLNAIEWSIIILVIGFVLAMELVNSAIEELIDYIKPEIHPKAKKIKDISAGAVLITVFVSVIIGFIIFLPKIIQLIV